MYNFEWLGTAVFCSTPLNCFRKLNLILVTSLISGKGWAKHYKKKQLDTGQDLSAKPVKTLFAAVSCCSKTCSRPLKDSTRRIIWYVDYKKKKNNKQRTCSFAICRLIRMSSWMPSATRIMMSFQHACIFLPQRISSLLCLIKTLVSQCCRNAD